MANDELGRNYGAGQYLDEQRKVLNVHFTGLYYSINRRTVIW